MKALRYGWIIVGVGLFVRCPHWLWPVRLLHAASQHEDSLQFNYTQMGLLSGGSCSGIFSSRSSAESHHEIRVEEDRVTSLVCSSLSMFFLSRVSSFLLLLASPLPWAERLPALTSP